jgi:hypothetical protein
MTGFPSDSPRPPGKPQNYDTFTPHLLRRVLPTSSHRIAHHLLRVPSGMKSSVLHPLIGGKQLSGDAGIRQIIDPFDGSIVGEVGYADQKQASEAISAARSAFEKFKQAPAYERADILSRTSRLIQEQQASRSRWHGLRSIAPFSHSRLLQKPHIERMKVK